MKLCYPYCIYICTGHHAHIVKVMNFSMQMAHFLSLCIQYWYICSVHSINKSLTVSLCILYEQIKKERKLIHSKTVFGQFYSTIRTESRGDTVKEEFKIKISVSKKLTGFIFQAIWMIKVLGEIYQLICTFLRENDDYSITEHFHF